MPAAIMIYRAICVLLVTIFVDASQKGIAFKESSKVSERIEAIVDIFSLRSIQYPPALDPVYSDTCALRKLQQSLGEEHRIEDFAYLYGRQLAVFMVQWWSVSKARDTLALSLFLAHAADDSDADEGQHIYKQLLVTADTIDDSVEEARTELAVVIFMVRVLCKRGVSVEQVFYTFTPGMSEATIKYVKALEADPKRLIERIFEACRVNSTDVARTESFITSLITGIYRQLCHQNTYSLLPTAYHQTLSDMKLSNNFSLDKVLDLPLKVLDGNVFLHLVMDQIVLRVWDYLQLGSGDDVELADKLDIILDTHGIFNQ